MCELWSGGRLCRPAVLYGCLQGAVGGDAVCLLGLRQRVRPFASDAPCEMVQQRVPRGVEEAKEERCAGLGKCPPIMQVLWGDPARQAVAAAGAKKGVLLKKVP